MMRGNHTPFTLVVSILLWLPTILLGELLSSLLFRGGSFYYYACLISFPIACIFIASAICFDTNKMIIWPRMISFILIELAACALIIRVL